MAEMPYREAQDCINAREMEIAHVLDDPTASPRDRNRYMEVSSLCGDHLAGIKPE
jgi:hypothetical protein